jgi:hypothetical protein
MSGLGTQTSTSLYDISVLPRNFFNLLGWRVFRTPTCRHDRREAGGANPTDAIAMKLIVGYIAGTDITRKLLILLNNLMLEESLLRS